MKKLPIGIDNFKEIRTADYCYVDKTEFQEYLKDVDLTRVRQWYDGYSFLSESVYNPLKSRQISLFNILKSGSLDELKNLFHSFFASIPHDWYRKNDRNITRFEWEKV